MTNPFRELFLKWKKSAKDCCVIITKPPETMMVYLPVSREECYFFDSHPRKNMGAHWLTFSSIDRLEQYLVGEEGPFFISNEVIESGLPEEYSMFECLVVTLKTPCEYQPLCRKCRDKEVGEVSLLVNSSMIT